MTKGIFITGTDTDVGKTIVTAGIMHLLRSNGYKAIYFKAALSGAIEQEGNIIPGDTKLVSDVSCLNESYENITPYVYKTAVSPHLAARIENNPINIVEIKEKYSYLKEKYDYIVAEGSGGIVCPLINDQRGLYLLQDLIIDLNMNLIVVARAGLGTINHTVLTIRYIESLGIKVKGIIINEYENSLMCNDNIELIKTITKAPILGILGHIKDLDDKDLRESSIRKAVEESIKVEDLINSMDEI